MLIRSLRAENFMRFSRLDVRDFPLSGIIGIEGPNESGKTTLGEVLLFALFGKTRLSSDGPAASLIRWGGDSMHVEVEFTIAPSDIAASPVEGNGGGPGAGSLPPQPGSYLLYRQIDKAGTNYVKIVALPSRAEVASGNIQVAQFIASSVRFDFREFQKSFYYDQNESRKAHGSQVDFVEAATGVKHLRETVDEIQKDVAAFEREFAYYQREISRNVSQMEKYDRNALKIPDLSTRVSRVDALLAECNAAVADRSRALEETKSEAAGRQERARRVDRLASLPLDALPQEAEKLLGEDEASSRKRGDAAGEPARAGGGSWRHDLAQLDDLSRNLVDLHRSVRDELEAIEEKLDPEAADGLPSRKRALECSSKRVARRSERLTLATIIFLVLGLSGLALIGYPLISRRQVPVLGDVAGTVLWVLAAATACSLLASLSAFVGGARARKDRAIAEHSALELSRELESTGGMKDRLRGLLQLGGPVDAARLLDAAEASGSRGIARKAQDIRERTAADPIPALDGLRPRIQALVKSDRDARARILSGAQKIEKELQEEEARLKKAQGERDRIEGELRECQSQLSKKEVLEEKNRELEKSAREVREEIDLRLLSCRLLEETISGIQGKVGPALTRFVKNVLPRLTSGRYRDAKVESNLEIKVFSSEKNDFLGLHELSGGTSEALCLALRFAISQAFVAARTRQAQFVFLDEPFQMMDSERAAETLKLLRHLSPELKQFLVIQPNFTEAERRLFDCRIRTRPEAVVLEASCTPEPSPADETAAQTHSHRDPASRVAD